MVKKKEKKRKTKQKQKAGKQTKKKLQQKTSKKKMKTKENNYRKTSINWSAAEQIIFKISSSIVPNYKKAVLLFLREKI